MPEGTAKKPRGRPFPPGNNANPKGRPRGSYLQQFKDRRENADLVDWLFKAAQEGSVVAMRLILERTEGLPVQQVDVTGGISVKVTYD